MPTLMDKELLDCASRCFKLLGHPMRLKIIDTLMQGSFTVNEVSQICQLPQNQVSEHLRLMKDAKMLDSCRDGRAVYYRIVNQNLLTIVDTIKKNCS